MSLSYSFIDTLKLLSQAFKYDIFIAIILSSIILTIILIINKDRKIINYIVAFINIVLIIDISYYYLNSILTFKFSNPINNIYFYFFNNIIYLIIMTIFTFKSKKNINFVFYGLSLINILFSLFMTYYLSNVTLVVIGNIYPMIKFGNIIYIVYYVYIFIRLIKKYVIVRRNLKS